MHRRTPYLILLLLLFFASGLLAVAPASAAPARFAGTSPVWQLIVTLQPAADRASRDNAQRPALLDALSARAGTQLSYARAMSGGAHVLRLPAAMPVAQAEQIAARLRADPGVLSAEPDYMNHIMAAPNDPLFSQQWDFGPVSSGGANIEAAWAYTTGDPNLTIAVIDTGIRAEHPDLAGRLVAGKGYDFISFSAIANDGNGRDADPTDPGDWVDPNECGDGDFNFYPSSWHGTHVAGTIAAVGNNGVGVAGINWQSKLLILRALGKCGGTLSDIADAMRWAAGIAVPGVPANTHPARVINMSLGGNAFGCPQTYQSAINDVVARGTVVVVAAGNEDQPTSISTPANCNNVIVVGATTHQRTRASYSNYGPEVDISAPGGEQSFSNDPEGILSTLNDGSTTPGKSVYRFYQGTSMATPHVVGVASLILSLDSSLTPAQVENILKNNVTPFPSGGCTAGNGNCGAGMLNAAAALAALRSPAQLVEYTPPTGARGLSYQFQFVAIGAPTPTFDLQSGTLPDGLTLGANGVISGVPTALGTWDFTIRATNGVGTPATRAVQLTIEQRSLFFLPAVGVQN
ncbi:MAG: S8 family serine peptidase [Kouleothrix sp.]